MGGGNVSQDQTSIICIDLKSFYASVECVERGLDPFKANLVVADPTRSKSTICLAITPAMKALGIKNRCRIHEIPDCVKYITAMPRMQLYMDYSAKIYGIYLRYVSKEDIHVYSVDECFIDVTNYLQLYHLTAKEMAVKLMQEVMEETGITATAGVGTNLYLAKIAMDIVAKHVDDHIGILDEFSYREQLWDHKPLSDFWRIGSRTEKKLAGYGIHTMGDIAMASLRSEDWLYKMFGIDAELLIDHAWGYETCRMSDIKNYHSEEHSLSNGQVLMRNYSFDEALVIVREMTDNLVLDLFEKGLVTSSLTLWIAYDHRYEHEASYVLNHCGNGWNYGRLTAEGLRGVCTYVSPGEAKPGDLIFFQGTYNTSGASHVGIYVGNNMMIHCGDPIHYSNISTSYWQQHFMCFGRLP